MRIFIRRLHSCGSPNAPTTYSSVAGGRRHPCSPQSPLGRGWRAGILFFAACAFFAWRADQHGASLAFLPFIILGALLLLTMGSLEVDEAGLVYRNRLGRYRISWQEIQRVESDGQTLVLCGSNKHLPFAPSTLGAKHRAEFMAYVLSRLETQGVPLIPSRVASYRLPRNTKF